MPNYEGIAFKVIISKNFDGVVFKTVMLSGAKIMDSQINAESTWSSEHLAKLLPKGEASGSIATFEDGAGDVPLISCVADFMATQDLHGLPAPYPAGASRNMWAYGDQNVTTTYKAIELDKPLPAGTYVISAKISSTYTTVASRFRKSDGSALVAVTLTPSSPDRSSAIVELPEPAYFVYLYSANGQSGYSATWSDIQIESGTTATDYVPYSNICPIIPIDEVNITRAGKNLCNLFKDGKVPSIVDGSLVNASTGGRTDYIKALPNTYYTFSIGASIANIYMFFYDKNKNYISYTGSNTTSISYKTPANCGFIMLRTSSNPIDVVTPQLEVGSTATEYSQPISTTETINLGSDYHGGSVDAVDGKITKTHQFYNSLSDGISNVVKDSNSWRVYYSNAIYESNNQYKEGICDKLAFKTSYSGVNGNNCTIAFLSSAGTQILLRNDSLTSAQEVRDFMASLEVVYPLATPIEAQAENVASISTLDGVNNIFADSGDVDVQYFLDIKKYIDNLVNPSNTRILSNGLNLTREAPSVPDEVEEEEEESQETNEER